MIDYSTFPMAALVVSYNVVAKALSQTQVKKFSDKPTAVKRLAAIIDQAKAAGIDLHMAPNGAVIGVIPSESTTGFLPPSTAMVHDAKGQLVDGTVMVPYETLAEKTDSEVVSTDGTTTVAEPAKERAKRKSSLMGKTITLEVSENPKRNGSRTRVRYALYTTGMTTDEYMEKCLAGGLGTKREILSDLSYDSEMGFIKLS